MGGSVDAHLDLAAVAFHEISLIRELDHLICVLDRLCEDLLHYVRHDHSPPDSVTIILFTPFTTEEVVVAVVVEMGVVKRNCCLFLWCFFWFALKPEKEREAVTTLLIGTMMLHRPLNSQALQIPHTSN